MKAIEIYNPILATIRGIVGAAVSFTTYALALVGLIFTLTVTLVTANYSQDEIKDAVAVILIKSDSNIFSKQAQLISIQQDVIAGLEQKIKLQEQERESLAAHLQGAIAEKLNPSLYQRAKGKVMQYYESVREYLRG